MQIEKNETEAARVFKGFRKSQGITQIGLSHILHISQGRVSRIERGGIVDHEEWKLMKAKLAEARKARNGGAK